MDSETIYLPTMHAWLDLFVQAGLEATIGAPIAHMLITMEDGNGRVVIVAPDDQAPNVSHYLAQSTLDRLS
jgi:hypothetical protein